MLRLCKVEFAYEASNDEELTVAEDVLVFVLDDEDAEWWKVRVKTPAGDTTDAPAEGLVPASYLIAAELIAHVTSLYAYEATNEEELSVEEDERLVLFEDEGDWALVGRADGLQGVGFMPSAWIERSEAGGTAMHATATADSHEEVRPATPAEDTSLTSSSAPMPTSPTSAHATGKAARNVQTWNVTSIDAKKKKKKGTLGVGNGALFFASESDKQYPLSSYVSHSTEKSKHLLVNFGPDAELHFSLGSKEMLEEIVAKLESDRAAEAEPVARNVLPPLASSTNARPPPGPTGAFLPPPTRRTASTSAPAPARSPSPPPVAAPNAASTAGHATALYDFDGEADDELSVHEGERLFVLDGTSDEWWKVRRAEGDGAEGVVPASYVDLDPGVELDAPVAAAAAVEDEPVVEPEPAVVERDPEQSGWMAQTQRVAAEARPATTAARPMPKPEMRRPTAPVPAPPVVTAPPPSLPKRAPAADSDRPKPSASKVRTWRDRTGQFKVEAEFLGVKDGKLRLHKSNGVIIEVPAEKMSAEDMAWLRSMRDKHMAERNKSAAPVGDDDVPLANSRKAPSSRPSTASSSSLPQAAAKPKRKEVDWFEFFLNAGCDMDDCTRYAHNFSRDKMDESVLPDLDASTLRTLGLREGDILRVMKHVRALTGALPKAPDAGPRDAEQIRKDEELARQLQAQDGGSGRDGSGLFSSSTGALKSTRRGRPDPSSRPRAASAVSADLLGEAASRIATPPLPSKSPLLEPDGARRPSSTAPVIGGFDDDAWTVKPSTKPATPAPAPAPAPTPPPPPPAPTPPLAALSLAAPPERPQSAADASRAYNDGLLAGMGVQLPRPASVGAYARQSPAPTGQSQLQPPSFGPRGPVAPVASNAPLLTPLVPTNTGFNSFIPTRPSGMGGLMAQPTGFQQPMQTGFQQPMATGFQQSMQTGYQQPMQTGYVPPPPPPMPMQQPSFLQSQPTGYGAPSAPAPLQAQMTGFAPGGIRQWSPQPPAAPTPTPSTPVDRYQPQNVFASMKTGQIGQNANAQPQPEQKYDALRSQPTGFAGFTPQFGPGMVPQPTGYMPQQQPQQQQQYGQPMQPQQTGMYGQPYRQY